MPPRNAKPLKCRFCNRTFWTGSNHVIEDHLQEFIAFTGLSLTGLPTQNTTSSQPSHEMAHTSTSTKVPQKAYNCVIHECDKSFTDMESLVRHEKAIMRRFTQWRATQPLAPTQSTAPSHPSRLPPYS